MDNLLKADRRTFMRRGAMGAGAAWMQTPGVTFAITGPWGKGPL